MTPDGTFNIVLMKQERVEMHGSSGLKTVEPYKDGDIAKLLAAADMAGEPPVGVSAADMADALLGEEAAAEDERPFRVRPVIPKALFVTNMVSNERQRIGDQIGVARRDLSSVDADIEAANADLAAVNERLRELRKKRANIAEDIADLERADAICEAALLKADEPTA